jgi:rhamnopyranosyl-N-acetylglucosaminyl-diphospho-decaprenol beta-1,3/1,4-galactofuranosyltransferase
MLAVVIVSFNRRDLLKIGIKAVLRQTTAPDLIIVIDNASTDGTADMLRSASWSDPKRVLCLQLPENVGGAGGFAAGIDAAVTRGADWIWLMDDDCEPEIDALEELVRVAKRPDMVYGSLAVSGAKTAWPMTLVDEGGARAAKVVERVDDVPDIGRVGFLPFLGLMVSRELVGRIGLPDAGFFISGDDVEYCLRAGRAGAPIYVVGRSRVAHPASDWYPVRLPGKVIRCLRLPPWKRYYDTRNRLLIGRRYYGHRFWTQTIPGTVARLVAALFNEQKKAAQFFAFSAGLIDGILGVKGKRHRWWGIKQ